MEKPTIPANETDRLLALKEYSILDTLPEEDFEDITKIASEICQTPIALITLVDTDRQWFKSHRGLRVSETPREFAFCAHAINAPDKILTVKDARLDLRFEDNPLVTGYPNVIFYTGVPLNNPDGFALGTLCVIDNKPRELSAKQLDSLQALSNQVVKLLEFRKLNEKLRLSQEELLRRNEDLEQFTYMISHDIKAPLNNVLGISTYLLEDHQEGLAEEPKEMLELIHSSTSGLVTFIDRVLSHQKGFKISAEEKQTVRIPELVAQILELLDPTKEHEFTLRSELSTIEVNEFILSQILTNLISNSIKYNDKPTVKIELEVKASADRFHFMVQDNGTGIDPGKFSRIFEPFTTLGKKDRFNKKGSGIGLATVKQLVEKLGGEISVDSEIGTGTSFRFSILK